MNDLYFLLMHMNPCSLAPAVKRRYRHSIKATHNDPLSASMRDHQWRDFWLCDKDPWRRVWNNDDCWESWREYTIMPDCGWSDTDIQHSVDELEVTTGSAYDCSGKPFSRFIHWKRTKAGIVIVRHMSIDI